MLCCRKEDSSSADEMISNRTVEMDDLMKQEKESRYFLHPGDSQIPLSTHIPLYPPGRIIHVVRSHPKKNKWCCGREEPVYEAIWADNTDFNEVLISPTMVNDHMPDNVFDALEKVLSHALKPTTQTKLRDKVFAEAAHSRTHILDSTSCNSVPDNYCNNCDTACVISSTSANDSCTLTTTVLSLTSECDPTMIHSVHLEPDDQSSSNQLHDIKRHENDINIESSVCPNIVLQLDSNVVNTAPFCGDAIIDLAKAEASISGGTGYRYYYIPPSPSEYGDSPERDFPTVLNTSSLTGGASQPTKPQQVYLVDIGNTATSQWNGPFKQFFSSGPTGVVTTTDAEVHCSDNQSASGPTSDVHISLPLRSNDDKDITSAAGSVTAADPLLKHHDLVSVNVSLEEPFVATHHLTNGEVALIHEGHLSSSEDEDGQQLYDHYLGHYSKAGRGYPHGLHGCIVETTEDTKYNGTTCTVDCQEKLLQCQQPPPSSNGSVLCHAFDNNIKCPDALTADSTVFRKQLNDHHP